MKYAALIIQKFFRCPFWSQVLITSGSLVVLVFIWSACGMNIPPPTLPPPLETPRAELRARYGAVFALAFSPTGDWLASGTSDKMARIWDVSKGEVIHTMKGHRDVVTCLTISPDGRVLATGSADKTVKFWDTSKGAELRILVGHKARVSSIAFSPDGRWLASASEDQTIRLWDSSSGEQLHVLEGHNGKVNAVAFSPDGHLLASAGDDKTVRLWDPATGKLLRTLADNNSRIISIAFSLDGKLLASGASGVSGSPILFGFGAHSQAGIKLWNPATGNEESSFYHVSGDMRCLVFRPGSNILASGAAFANVSEITNWDVQTQTIISHWNAHRSVLYALAYSPDGRWLASGGDDGRIRLWQ